MVDMLKVFFYFPPLKIPPISPTGRRKNEKQDAYLSHREKKK